MKNLYLPLISLMALSAACGRANEVDSEFQPFLDTFMAECAATSNDCQIHTLSIAYVDDIPGETVGLCEVTIGQVPSNQLFQKVTIERKYKDAKILPILLAHEFHHCLRFVDHRPEEMGPHVMTPRMMSNRDFSKKPFSTWLKESFAWDVKFL